MKKKITGFCVALALALALCAGTMTALAATATPQADTPRFTTELSVRDKGATVTTTQQYTGAHAFEIVFTPDGQSLANRGGYGVAEFDLGVGGSHFVRITMEERNMTAWLFPIEGLAGSASSLPIAGGALDFATNGLGWVLNAVPLKFKFVTAQDYSKIDIYFALANATYAQEPNNSIDISEVVGDVSELKLTDGALRVRPQLHDSFIIQSISVDGDPLDLGGNDVTLAGGFARRFNAADFSVDATTESEVRLVSPVAVSTQGFEGEEEVFSLSMDIHRGKTDTAAVMNTTADFGVLFGMPTSDAAYTDENVGSVLNGANYGSEQEYGKGLVLVAAAKGNGTAAVQDGEFIGENKYWRANDTFFGKARLQLSAKANGNLDITFIVGYGHDAAATHTRTVSGFDMNGYVAIVCQNSTIDENDSIDFQNISFAAKEYVAPTGVTLNKSESTIKVGGTTQLNAVVAPNFVTDATVDWESSDPQIATVNGNGLVTGVGYGTATVTAKSHKDPTLTATCTVRVLKVATGITLDKEEVRIARAQKATVVATVAPAGECDGSVTWTSSDETVATVENGEITAISKGTATVTATSVDGGFKKTCAVTVYQPVNSITLDRQTLTMEIGDVLTLTATLLPADADDTTVTWTSSNEGAATVANGVVTAVGEGKTTVTVTTSDGVLSADCAITVYTEIVPVTGVALDKTEHTIAVGESFTLTATVAPENANEKAVTYASSDESVATVDADGKVTAHKAGTAVITATAGGGVHSATCTVTVTAKEDKPNKGCGCGSAMGGVAAGTAAGIALLTAAAVCLCRRKRANKA